MPDRTRDTDILSDEDRALVDNVLARIGGDSDIEYLLSIHTRHLREARRERGRLHAKLEGVERNIALRERAVRKLNERKRVPATESSDE